MSITIWTKMFYDLGLQHHHRLCGRGEEREDFSRFTAPYHQTLLFDGGKIVNGARLWVTSKRGGSNSLIHFYKSSLTIVMKRLFSSLSLVWAGQWDWGTRSGWAAMKYKCTPVYKVYKLYTDHMLWSPPAWTRGGSFISCMWGKIGLK